MAPARAEISNWVLGGRWVIEFMSCHPDESYPDLTPEGIEFSADSVLIHAPPGRASLGDKDFSAIYHYLARNNDLKPTRNGRFDRVKDPLIASGWNP